MEGRQWRVVEKDENQMVMVKVQEDLPPRPWETGWLDMPVVFSNVGGPHVSNPREVLSGLWAAG